MRWDDSSRTLEWNATGGYKGDKVYKQLKAVLWVPQAQAAIASAPAEIGMGGKLLL